MKKLTKQIIAKRTVLLAVFGASLYTATAYLNINIWYIVLFGIATGIIFGKVFCRWMCPIGFIMELLLGGGNNQFSGMYQYHKLGCPIAWASGFLNKWSLFRIRINKDTCISCGKCDKECYISTLDPAKYSLYRPKRANPGEVYSCSKCLKCVAACPNGSLSYRPKI